MNVKNLRQMFERQSIPSKEQAPKQTQPNRSKIPSQPLIKPPQIEVPQNKTPPPPIQLPIRMTENSRFREELNKKIGRQTTSVLKQQIQSLPDEIQYRAPQHMQRQQSQLNIDDIITGMEKYESKEEQINVRFGINEKYPNRPRQKTMFDKTITASGHKGNSSFTDMLQNMLSSLNRKKQIIPEPEESPKIVKKQTSKITNKLQYDQSYKTKSAKINRIDFVLKVIFRQKEYQNIGTNMLKTEQLKQSTVPQQKQSDVIESAIRIIQPKSKPQQKSQQNELKVEQIIQNKQRDHEQETISSTAKRSNMVSNNFLNELTMKLAKKSMGHSGQNTPTISPVNIHVQSISSTKINQQLKIEEEDLTPRQKKRARTHQKFDEY